MVDNNLSAMSFAEKLGVQRSGLSHLFSGRNKPSLDLILKIHEAFPGISLEWLLTDKGEMNAAEGVNIKSDEQLSYERKQDDVDYIGKHDTMSDLTPKPEVTEVTTETSAIESRPIITEGFEELILLYKDGTFRTLSKKRG